MTVKVTKDDSDIVVVPSGYGWLDRNNKEYSETFITVRTGTEQIVIKTSQVPALKDALDRAVAEADKSVEADLKKYRAKINANKASRKLAKE